MWSWRTCFSFGVVVCLVRMFVRSSFVRNLSLNHDSMRFSVSNGFTLNRNRRVEFVGLPVCLSVSVYFKVLVICCCCCYLLVWLCLSSFLAVCFRLSLCFYFFYFAVLAGFCCCYFFLAFSFSANICLSLSLCLSVPRSMFLSLSVSRRDIQQLDNWILTSCQPHRVTSGWTMTLSH